LGRYCFTHNSAKQFGPFLQTIQSKHKSDLIYFLLMLLMPSPNFQKILDRIQEVFLSAQILKSRRILAFLFVVCVFLSIFNIQFCGF
jgi:hypothetical protein